MVNRVSYCYNSHPKQFGRSVLKSPHSLNTRLHATHPQFLETSTSTDTDIRSSLLQTWQYWRHHRFFYWSIICHIWPIFTCDNKRLHCKQRMMMILKFTMQWLVKSTIADWHNQSSCSDLQIIGHNIILILVYCQANIPTASETSAVGDTRRASRVFTISSDGVAPCRDCTDFIITDELPDFSWFTSQTASKHNKITSSTQESPET